MKLRTALLIATILLGELGLPSFARAGVVTDTPPNPFVACQDVSASPRATNLFTGGSLHAAIAERKLEYYRRNAGVTSKIISCLGRLENWAVPFPEDCIKLESILKEEILEKNFAFRMSEALSARPVGDDPQRLKDIFDFDAQVDVGLEMAPGFGIVRKQSALIPGEVGYVRKAFVAFWKNFATRYRNLQSVRLERETLNKYERRDVVALLSRLGAALAETDDRRFLAQLSVIDDVNFRVMAEREFQNFRTDHGRAWRLQLESMRIIAFLGKPDPSVADMKSAFENFQTLGEQTRSELEKQLATIRVNLIFPTDDLLSDSAIVEEVLDEHPALCAVAAVVSEQQRRARRLQTEFVEIPLTLGFFATFWFAPPLLSLPLMVATDVYWVSGTQADLRHTQALFYATLTEKGQLKSSEEVHEAEGMAMMSLSFAPLTAANFTPKTLRSLVRDLRGQ